MTPIDLMTSSRRLLRKVRSPSILVLDRVVNSGEVKVYKTYESWRQGMLKRKRSDPNFNKRCKKSKKSDAKLDDSMALVNSIRDRVNWQAINYRNLSGLLGQEAHGLRGRSEEQIYRQRSDSLR